jgi:hypothetical protein
MPDLAPLPLGPFVLAGERALVILALAAGLVVAEVLGRRRGRDAEWAWQAVILGLVAARVGYVAANADVFAPRPLDAFAFWQGGFVPWVGVAVGLAYAAFAVRRRGVAAGAVVSAAGATGLAAVVALAVLPVAPTPPALADTGVVVERLEGGTVDVATWAGTPTVVNLWATWCGPCRRELPMLIDEVGGRDDVRLALVSQAEAADTVRAFLAEEGLPGDDVFLDRRGGMQGAARAIGLPTTLFVDVGGEVRDVAFGEVSRARVRAGVEAAMASRTP